MELRDLYTLSEIICEKVDKEELPSDLLENMEIKMVFKPTVFYGIDKEFYYLTHNSSYNGFVHSEVVNAKINGVKFNIHPERTEPEQKETIEML
jgi:hypothetical protein